MSEVPALRLRAPEELPSAVPHIVVGLGASAGGIRALKELFEALAPKNGMAFVVVLHLSPEHESHLAEVLQSSCRIPVMQVRTRTRIEPDHVYVVSPNNTLSLLQGYIDVAPIRGMEERRAPVDIFFRALAEAQRTRAVSVILSGTGADGSMGMKRVKECGGICIAQEPSEADFDGMPRNAIATGLVDYVLPAAEIAARLVIYREHLDADKLPEREDADQQDHALVDIFALLRVRTGHDFANYKHSTVLRRLERRLNVQEVGSLVEYAKILRENREEANALLRDLLISVTNFFRDAEAWKALEQTVIPKLFENKEASDHVRVWIPGCATGEEAYSVAMLLAEHAPDPIASPTLQVFATDIDNRALAKARTGLYTLNDAADVSPERLRRFFMKDGDAYRVRRELREMVLIAPHNVIKDPPFSHLDLITCRNLLIYLDRGAQDRVLRLFHFGLNPGGYLFLGSSETADDSGNLFVTLDQEQHIFQSRSIATPLALPVVPAGPPVLHAITEERIPESRMRERLSYQELHQRLLERYAPPSVIVTQDYEILHLSDHAGQYLRFVGGEPSQNLLKVVRPELRFELHSALYQAVQNRTTAEAVAGPVQMDGKSERVKLVVSPVFSELDTSRGIILVLFGTLQDAGEMQQTHIAGESAPGGEPIARQREEELLRAKLQLRTTIEQHELQQEALKASNEELQAMNEELRSSIEELETSKEELQSLNEELTTVNQELKIKIDELSEANNDTRNLMNSTDIATVFIDRAMRIKLFTPCARSIFNLIPTDSGRPLLDITSRLYYPELAADIERVLETLAGNEREVSCGEGHWYIARVRPYRTADDRIAGVVLTFTDITERKRAEEALRASEERVRLMVESVPDFAIMTVDTEGRVQSWNSGARDMFGYSEREAIGRHVNLLFSKEDIDAGVPEQEMREAMDSGRANDERWHVRKDGTRLFVSGVMSPLLVDGKLVGFTKIARDLTQREKHEQELREAREQLETRVRERTDELAQANSSLRHEIEERTQAEEVRLRLLRQLVSAQEDERRRISRELHDQLGQEISALGLKLSNLKSSHGLDASIQAEIEVLEQMTKRLDSDVDLLVWQLRPTGLDDLGLNEALSDYTESWSKIFGIQVRTHTDLEARLPAEVETVLYRIAQEALNNIAKHAAAKEVSIDLVGNRKVVSLTIRDDGKGFDTAAPPNQRAFGLLGMRERAALIGGTVTIESEPNAGTVIQIRVPV